MEEKLTKLGYEYDSLEPFIDAKTMEVHYSKHHQNYFNKLKESVKEHPDLIKKDIDEILSNLNIIPEEIKSSVINNGGGHSNHRFFWSILKKDVEFNGEISEKICDTYGSLESFKNEFKEKSIALFGSGWIWLVLNENNNLEIIQTKNQDSPLSLNKRPLIALDLWEHAYYLKHQNKRADYIEDFLNIINWEKVNEYFLK